jgi:hypothetical protein
MYTIVRNGKTITLIALVARVQHRDDCPPHSCVCIWKIWGDKEFLSVISGKNGMGVAI